MTKQKRTKQQEAVYTFLTDLRAIRQARSRLLELAQEHPDMALAYLESLTEQQLSDPEFKDLYATIRRITTKK